MADQDSASNTEPLLRVLIVDDMPQVRQELRVLLELTSELEVVGEAANAVQERLTRLLSVKGNRGIREIHRELGRIMWDDVGMARTEESLQRALTKIPRRTKHWVRPCFRSCWPICP